MRSNETSWSFPPALNTTFRDAFTAEYSQSNNGTEDHGVYAIMLAAVQNLTLQERVDSEFRNRGWGGEDAIVKVGDTVNGTFKNDKRREYGLNCILCKEGRGLGPIEHACSNYTDDENVVSYTKRFGPLPSVYLGAFPSLDQYSSIPENTCGLCIFTIFGDVFRDYSVPFPVQQHAYAQRKVFNATYPTGVIEPPLATSTLDPYNTPLPPVPQRPENNSNNTGLIVGVVVGVLFVASCLMGLIIWLWTRRHRTKKVDTFSNPVVGPAPGHSVLEPPSVALQRIRSVVRRPDSSASEVPPPYHEVVRAKETGP